MAGGLDLGKQVGPLPLGVWILVGAGGLGLGYVINRNMARNAAAASEAPSNAQLTETGVGTGGGQFTYDPPTTGTGNATPVTNQSWGVQATNWLISRNTDPALADQAVRKYLSGLRLTVQEQAVMNLVLIQFGTPPEPLPPTEEPETPTPPTTAAPPNGVRGLHVNKGTLRNEVVWTDENNEDNQVTHYVIEAQNLQNGKRIFSTVMEIPGKVTYSWTHVASPVQGVKTLPYAYFVRPYNLTMPGPNSRADATMTL